MTDLSTKYMGLTLRNPLIVGSSGLTASIENLKAIDKKGAGAVVLKSIFEEQIRYESDKFLESDDPGVKSWKEVFNGIVSKTEFYHDEAFEYLTSYARDHTLDQYLKLISEAKKTVAIPVIASINCRTQYDWEYFARKIQDAGADALELNMYVLPSDFDTTGNDNEKIYFDTIKEVRKHVTIPVSLKIGYYFSSLAHTALKLSETGISALTLFSRPYNPDIDIEQLGITSSNIFSREHEYSRTLRWVALLSGKLKCDIAASGGIHNAETIIKQLLAGADTVHMVSAFYKHKFDIIPDILKSMEIWMTKHNFKYVQEFRGLLSKSNINNPSSYERVQFIRTFSGIE